MVVPAQLKQYESALHANREAARSAKYIIEFRLCLIPARKRTLLTSFRHTRIKTCENTLVVDSSLFKKIKISLSDFFLTVSEYQLAKAVIEHLIETKIHEKAFTLQVYIVSNTKIDEYSVGFALKAMASSKLTELTRKNKEDKT